MAFSTMRDGEVTVVMNDYVYKGRASDWTMASSVDGINRAEVSFFIDTVSAKEDSMDYTTTTTGTTLGCTMIDDEHSPYTTVNISVSDIEYKESNEMAKNVEYVYIPYAINQRTKETWEGDRMTGVDYQATLQRAILENAYNINMLGDSDDIYVWLGEVGEFEPIE